MHGLRGVRMTFLRARRFLRSLPARVVGSHVPNNGDGITRLHASAPTVTQEEMAALERKRRKPVDFENLPV